MRGRERRCWRIEETFHIVFLARVPIISGARYICNELSVVKYLPQLSSESFPNHTLFHVHQNGLESANTLHPMPPKL